MPPEDGHYGHAGNIKGSHLGEGWYRLIATHKEMAEQWLQGRQPQNSSLASALLPGQCEYIAAAYSGSAAKQHLSTVNIGVIIVNWQLLTFYQHIISQI